MMRPTTITRPALPRTRVPLRRLLTLVITAFFLSGCGANAVQLIPTDRPTITPTPTATRSQPRSGSVTPTVTPSPARTRAPGEPSPTPLFGPTQTVDPAEAARASTPTRSPNAPRIEFFTSDKPAAAPGESLTLFWSTRGGSDVRIYQLRADGARNRVWNVAADGRQVVQTDAGERGQLTFLLIVGEGDLQTEQRLAVPLQCPVPWFFAPAPQTCPDDLAFLTQLIEQNFERGRMIYVAASNLVYVLFNDGFAPAWVVFENRYNPEIHPEFAENYVPPAGFFQPIARLGFVWRGNDTVRNRLGNGIEQEIAFESLIQREGDTLYISSTNGTIVQLLPGSDVWQIILPQPIEGTAVFASPPPAALPTPATPSPAAQPPPLATSPPG